MSIRFTVLTGFCDEMLDPNFPAPGAGGTFNPLANLNAWITAAIAQEPDDVAVAGNLALRGPITRWVGYAFGNPRMLPSAAAALLPLQPGDPNPFFQIVDAVEREGGTLKLGNSPFAPATAYPISREEWHKIGYYVALAMTGGDAEGAQVYFQVSSLSDAIPATFPNRTYFTGDEESQVENIHTWETWYEGMPGHAPRQIGGNWYCSSANTWGRGEHVKASEWLPAYLGGLTVLSQGDFAAVEAAA